jgi:hypothetical protein
MRYAIVVGIVISAVPGRAHAQATAVAEQLFNEGRDLAAQGKWSEACPKFEASLQRDPALGTRLNLATCYQHVNKLASAWGLFRESADIAKKANDTKRFDYAMQQAAVLEPRLPKLVITAPPKAPTGLVVQRDGTPVSAAELGVGLYVDPGPHEVTASAPGFDPVTSKISVDEAKTETLALPELKPKADTAQPAVVKPEDDAGPTEPVSPTRKYIGLGVGGGGIVMVGVGLVFGAQAISKNNKAKDLCGDDLTCTGSNLAEGQQLIHDGRSRGTLSTVFVAAGIAAIGAGVVVYLTAPRASEQPHATASLVPIIDRDGAGLGVVGRF